MKALTLTAYKQLTYGEAPRPAVGAGEVLVAVKACGICGSDVHGYDGSTGRRRPPVVMGHEAAGAIAETGAGVADWRVGDRVTFDSTLYCGECGFCRAGRINLCDRRRVLGVSCGEYRCDGAFADYVAVPARILYRLPDGLSFADATMVEALSIAVHAAGRARPRLGDAAVVVGAGMIGLLVVQTLRAAGCGPIAVLDVDDDKLALARRLGADAAWRSDDDGWAARLADLTRGRLAEQVFEVVGLPATVALAARAVAKGGTVTLVGNLAAEAVVPLQALVTREITLYGSCASAGEYPAALEMIARGAVKVGPLIGAVAPLAEGAAWFGRLYAKEKGLMKVILTPEGEGHA